MINRMCRFRLSLFAVFLFVIIGRYLSDHITLFCTGSSCSLSCFPSDKFTFVFDSLPLVGFGGSEGADLRGHLTDKLFVYAADGDIRLRWYLNLDALRRRKENGMRVSHKKLKLFPLHFCDSRRQQAQVSSE